MARDKNHWENIYRTKQPEEVSWMQVVPATSLAFIHGFGLPRTARIVDDLWHDRAAFHFLTTGEQITTYLSIARDGVRAGGYAVVGTFSDQGPDRCSGLPVRRYDERLLTDELSRGFSKIRCVMEDHITPFHTKQHFLFCSFKRSQEPALNTPYK